MAVFNRVYCSNCRKEHSIYDEKLRRLVCKKCGNDVLIKAGERNYFIEYYANGVRKREKIGSSRTLAETVYQKRKVEIAEGKFLDIKKQNRLKFNEFAQEYLNLHSKVNNKSWAKTDVRNITGLNKFFADRYLHEITPRLIEEFKAKRIEEVSPARVNRLLACLKSIYSKAILWGRYSGDNPVKKVKMFKENNERTRFLEKEEIIKLLSNCNKGLRPIVVVALNTGMRLGEILGLKWRDIDIQRGIIYLYNTKNGEKRELPVNEQVKTAFIRTPKHPKSEFVFHLPDGSQRKDIRFSFFTALAKSAIKDFRFHDLRHTFASQLVMGGVDLNTVRELLGHKTMKMTLRYSHLSGNHKQRAVDVLNKRMDSFWTPSVSTDKAVSKQVLVTA